MPELPEVEHLRRSLARRLVGARIIDASVTRDDIVARGSCGVGARRGALAIGRQLVGRSFRGFGRHGKLLLTALDDDRFLLIHLGMSGQLLLLPDLPHSPIQAPVRPIDHIHLRLRLEIPGSGRTRGAARAAPRPERLVLAFRDPRRFGGIALTEAGRGLPPPWSAAGVDAFTGRSPDEEPTIEPVPPEHSPRSPATPRAGVRHPAIDPRRWRSLLGSGRQPIKSALLDQRRVAGLGNIYADEVLHQCRIHPGRLCRSLTAAAWSRIAIAVHETLTAAVDAGGSSIRDYVDPDRRPGTFSSQHAVYGRSGLPCRRCGRPLVHTIIGGRRSVWCPSCQRRPTPETSRDG